MRRADIGTAYGNQEFASFGSGPDFKYSRASAFRSFLSTTMVFAAVRTHFPKKNTLFISKESRSTNSGILSCEKTSKKMNTPLVDVVSVAQCGTWRISAKRVVWGSILSGGYIFCLFFYAFHDHIHHI